MKDTYLKWKKTSNWINNRLDTTEEKKISEFEHLTIDTNKNEEYRKKKKNKQNFSELWENITWSNTYIMRSRRRQWGWKTNKQNFKDIMAGKFPTLMKSAIPQIQVQLTPWEMNIRWLQKDNIIKLLKNRI